MCCSIFCYRKWELQSYLENHSVLNAECIQWYIQIYLYMYNIYYIILYILYIVKYIHQKENSENSVLFS